MSQGEIVRPADLGLASVPVAAAHSGRRRGPDRHRQHAAQPRAAGRTDARLMRATVGDCGLDDTLEAIREEMRKFADSEVVPHAQRWHLDQRATSRSRSSRRWRSSACSA